MPAGAERRRRRGAAERQEQQSEPDRAQLAQRLQVEVVRVADLVLDRPVLVPVLLVRARSPTEEGVVPPLVPGLLPELGPVAAREREQAVAEVRVRAGRRLLERVVGPVDHVHGAAEPDDDSCQGSQSQYRDDGRERQPDVTRRLVPPLRDRQSDGRGGRGEREQRDEDRKLAALVGHDAQRRVAADQPLVARADRGRDQGGDPDDEQRHEELEPAWIERNGGRETHDERDPRAAAEREVERGQQHDERRSRERPDRHVPLARHGAEREEQAERHEDREAVPVAERLGEAVRRHRVVGADPFGEKPRQEPVGRDHERARRGRPGGAPEPFRAGRR